ncbi:hypothetical protein DKP78_17170, partial [Enterococcus faecium]
LLQHERSSLSGGSGSASRMNAGRSVPEIAKKYRGADGEGRIGDADRGTLFLDEIDSMSATLQGKLLRVIEERELPAVGGGSPRSIDLRIVAAAKGDLAQACTRG